MLVTAIIFIGIASTTGIVGASMTVKGLKDSLKVNEINMISNNKIRRITAELNYNKQKSSKMIEDLAKEKIRILEEDITDFVDNYQKIKNVTLEDSIGLDELKTINIDKNTIVELKSMVKIASEVGNGMAKGGAGGALLAYGAYGAAMKLAVASTGTAISGLSGVAASNATLAFFGGGSLATGGLGVAGGTMILGGLVAGPALLVMGIITGNKSGKDLEKALTNEEKVNVTYQQIDAQSYMCVSIFRRTKMFLVVLKKLSCIFKPEIEKMKDIINNSGDDYKKYSDKEKDIIKKNILLAGTIKSILDVRILAEDGTLTAESENLINDIETSF